MPVQEFPLFSFYVSSHWSAAVIKSDWSQCAVNRTSSVLRQKLGHKPSRGKLSRAKLDAAAETHSLEYHQDISCFVLAITNICFLCVPDPRHLPLKLMCDILLCCPMQQEC